MKNTVKTNIMLVDDKNMENQNTSEEKKDMNKIFENEELAVYMYGIKNTVTGHKKLRFAVVDLETGKPYISIYRSMRAICCDKAVFDEFYDFGLMMEDVNVIRDEAKKRLPELKFEKSEEWDMSIEAIRETLIKKIEAHPNKDNWKLPDLGEGYYNVPNAVFKKMCQEEDFGSLSYGTIIGEFKNRKYLKCNSTRHDYHRGGVKGICLIPDEHISDRNFLQTGKEAA